MRANYIKPGISIWRHVDVQRIDGESMFQAAERLILNEGLSMTDGRQNEAATLTGVTPASISRKMLKYGQRSRQHGRVRE